MAILISGTTNDIIINGASVATDTEVSSAVAPLATKAYVASAVAPKANTADLKEIGVGQTWQDVTASRAIGVTYTNTTGKPIEVIITGTNMSSMAFSITIDGVQRAMKQGSGSYGVQASLSIIVPNNSTYAVLVASSTITSWQELR